MAVGGVGQIDIRKALVDGLVFLLMRGWVLPVLSFMLERAATADVALHLHFVDKVATSQRDGRARSRPFAHRQQRSGTGRARALGHRS